MTTTNPPAAQAGSYRVGDPDLNRIGYGAMQLSTVSLDQLAEAQRIAPVACVLESVAKRLGATTTAVAQSWLLQHSPNIMLIPGTCRIAGIQ
jgi:predicted oxidoreductase